MKTSDGRTVGPNEHLYNCTCPHAKSKHRDWDADYGGLCDGSLMCNCDGGWRKL